MQMYWMVSLYLAAKYLRYTMPTGHCLQRQQSVKACTSCHLKKTEMFPISKALTHNTRIHIVLQFKGSQWCDQLWIRSIRSTRCPLFAAVDLCPKMPDKTRFGYYLLFTLAGITRELVSGKCFISLYISFRVHICAEHLNWHRKQMSL